MFSVYIPTALLSHHCFYGHFSLPQLKKISAKEEIQIQLTDKNGGKKGRGQLGKWRKKWKDCTLEKRRGGLFTGAPEQP